nr:MAG TPA: hypothetical protein [Caudoviricetes sp.]
MSTIKNYVEMSAMHKAIQNEKLWEQALSIQKIIPNYWESSELIALQQSIQLAIQPTLDAIAPLSSAIAESMAGMSSINKLNLGLQQVQDIHKLIQPMTEYRSALEDLELAFSNVSFPELAVSSEELPQLEELPSLESTIELLPGERRLVELLIKDENPLNWFRAHFPKLSKVTVEDAQIFIFLLILEEIVIPCIKSAIKG